MISAPNYDDYDNDDVVDHDNAHVVKEKDASEDIEKKGE